MYQLYAPRSSVTMPFDQTERTYKRCVGGDYMRLLKNKKMGFYDGELE